MTEPEIARRCPNCGASIRDRAFFCPQCGNEVGAKTEADETAIKEDGENSAQATPAEEQAAEQKTTEEEQENPNPVSQDTVYEPASPDERANSEPATAQATSTASQRPGGAAPAYNRNPVKRAAASARGAIEGDVTHRVEKLRKISHTVIDEAAYDPSLRFILIAAVLFGIFLFILLLNKLID